MNQQDPLLNAKSPMGIHKIYSHFSSSILLENKASVARDHLANERTFLAWLRTSFTLITVGIAITQLYRITPETEPILNIRIIGATFIIFSILFLYFANARYFHAQIALTKGRFPASRGAVFFGSICIFALFIAMFVTIVIK